MGKSKATGKNRKPSKKELSKAAAVLAADGSSKKAKSEAARILGRG